MTNNIHQRVLCLEQLVARQQQEIVSLSKAVQQLLALNERVFTHLNLPVPQTIPEHLDGLAKHHSEPTLSPIAYLTDWTGFRSARLLFDTDTNGWEPRAFASAVLGKQHTAYINFTQTGHVFGGFVFSPIQPKWTHEETFFVFQLAADGRRVLPRRFLQSPGASHATKAFVLHGGDRFYQIGGYPNGFFSIEARRDRCFGGKLNVRFAGLAAGELTGSAEEKDRFVVDRFVVVEMF